MNYMETDFAVVGYGGAGVGIRKRRRRRRAAKKKQTCDVNCQNTE